VRRLWIGLGLAAALAAPARAEELLVAAAVSLREPLEAIAQRFEKGHPGVHVQLAFGASSALVAQAKAGAPFDLFLSADEQSLDALAEAGLLRAGTRRTLVSNRLVVIASPSLSIPIASASDLARLEVRRIAVAEQTVPVGHYARQWLAGRQLLERLEPRLVPLEHARATLAAVDAGNAEAGIVYATDARVARAARVAFTPPDREQPRIRYGMAQVTSGRAPGMADEFQTALGSPEARRELAAAGFLPPLADEAP
jgi:molybdate transport system substrate-binding protein